MVDTEVCAQAYIQDSFSQWAWQSCMMPNSMLSNTASSVHLPVTVVQFQGYMLPPEQGPQSPHWAHCQQQCMLACSTSSA